MKKIFDFFKKFYTYLKHDIKNLVERIKGKKVIISEKVSLRPTTPREEIYAREILRLQARIEQLEKQLRNVYEQRKKDIQKKIKEALKEIKEEQKKNRPVSIAKLASLIRQYKLLGGIYVYDIEGNIIGKLKDIEYSKNGVAVLIDAGKNRVVVVRGNDLPELIYNWENVFNYLKRRVLIISGIWDGKKFTKVPWQQLKYLLYDNTGKTTVEYVAMLLEELRKAKSELQFYKSLVTKLTISSSLAEIELPAIKSVLNDLLAVSDTLLNKIYHIYLPKMQAMAISYADAMYSLAQARTVIGRLKQEIETLRAQLQTAEKQAALSTVVVQLQKRVEELERLLSDIISKIAPHVPSIEETRKEEKK